MVFLLCRDRFLTSSLNMIPNSGSFLHVRPHPTSDLLSPHSFVYVHFCVVDLKVTKMIDGTRSALFDIINQYHAIFQTTADEEEVLAIFPSSSLLLSFIPPFLHALHLSLSAPPHPHCQHARILGDFVNVVLAEFIQKLSLAFSSIKGASFLSNVISSAMFFARNMGKVGFDFRGALLYFFFFLLAFSLIRTFLLSYSFPLSSPSQVSLIPVFERAIVSFFQRRLLAAHQSFSLNLRRYKNLSAHTGLSSYGSSPGTYPVASGLPHSRSLPFFVISSSMFNSYLILKTSIILTKLLAFYLSFLLLQC